MGADKKGDPEKGKEVFQQCGVCHNADSTEKKMGPGLKGLFAKEKMSNDKKPTEANVRAKIDEVNHSTMKLAENMMNTAVRGALKGTRI